MITLLLLLKTCQHFFTCYMTVYFYFYMINLFFTKPVPYQFVHGSGSYCIVLILKFWTRIEPYLKTHLHTYVMFTMMCNFIFSIHQNLLSIFLYLDVYALMENQHPKSNVLFLGVCRYLWVFPSISY